MKASIWILLFLLLGGVSEGHTLIYGNETVDIRLALDSCSSTETVFRIERLNYTSGIEPLTVNYLYIEEGINTTSTDIQKTINKYSSSKTGDFNADNIPQRVGLRFDVNTTLYFDTTGVCGTLVPATDNVSIVNATNSTPVLDNETSETNHTNATINTSSPAPVVVLLPPTQETNPICPTRFQIIPSDTTIKAGERLTYSFSFDTEPEDYSIDYWIEDAQGETLKKKISTTNTNKKSYTIPQKLSAGSYILLHATTSTSCGSFSTSAVVGIAMVEQTESVVLEVKQRRAHKWLSTSIEHAASESYELLILDHEQNMLQELGTMHVKKGQDLSLLLPLHLQATGPFVILEARAEDRHYRTYHALPEEQKAPVKQSESSATLIRSYTRQSKMSDTLNWYVRSEGDAPYTVRVRIGNETQEETVHTSNAQTTTFTFTTHNASPLIATTLIQGNFSHTNTSKIVLTQTALQQAQPAQPNTSLLPITGAATSTSESKTIPMIAIVGGVILLGGIWQQRRLIKEATFIKRWWPLKSGESHEKQRNQSEN